VKGFQFSEAYRSGRWDGKVHLLKVNTKGASLPIGLYDEALRFVEDLGETPEIVDARKIPDAAFEPQEWPRAFEPRDYQTEAVDSLLVDGLSYLHGVIRSPIRSGKTVIQARLVHKVGKRAVVLVGSKAALSQTYKVFRRVFGRTEVGILGDGRKASSRSITVASVQTVTADPVEAERAFRDVSLLVIDEYHHYSKSRGRKKGNSWKELVEDVATPFKVGFSGTIYFDEKGGTNEEDIWLRANAGPITYSISMRRLIDLGYLVEPTIYFIPFEDRIEAPVYHEAYRELLGHPRRNGEIIRIARATADAGEKTIVVTSRIEQAEILGELLAAGGVRHAVLTGPVDSWTRDKAFGKFCDESSGFNVLVGTVFNETVDLPPASVVINASGGTSRGGTIQKMRNLTAHDGKERAIVFDFADMGHKDFRKHSRARRNHYRNEGLACRLFKGDIGAVIG
jgi:superfamily II DNA or RNA helicase